LPHRHYEDSEWQADAFAAEFLMPLEHVLRLPRLTAAAASVRFKVSLRAAMVRMNVLRNEGLLRMK
jgi:Zn-dependent peptidase ImmA (M78 family)